MAQIDIHNLSFSYAQRPEDKVLQDISLSFGQGEFAVLCGPCGCGKTTLLRQLKPVMAPGGTVEGEILFDGTAVRELDERQQAGRIGYVAQNPDDQIVTDMVWHELAFGPESLGLSQDEIRLRVAETATYFDIQQWLHEKTSELSRGRKQILNLASVMTLRPDILLLDEPVGALDPVSSERFMHYLKKLNCEAGVTVIMADHSYDCAGPNDRVILMEGGTVKADGRAREMREDSAQEMRGADSAKPGGAGERTHEDPLPGHTALELRDVHVRYYKRGRDILHRLSMTVQKGSVHALIGGNGAGKTTLLKTAAGLINAQRGSVRVNAGTAYLPEQALDVLTGPTVADDLRPLHSPAVSDDFVSLQGDTFGVSGLLDRHPCDLSGGEIMRAAIMKVVMTDADLLIFDEPTQYADAAFKENLKELFDRLCNQGKTILFASHDLDFVADCADAVSFIFDGEVAASGSPAEVFAANRYFVPKQNFAEGKE